MATKNNFRRLKEEADIGMVLSYLQIPIKKAGNNYFIKCPNPNHADTHATNCYFREGWNNVYCCACGESMKALDIIMWITGCSYGEAADILWKIEGCPEWYYSKNYKQEQIDFFSITRDEANVIGINYPGHFLCPIGFSQFKTTLTKEQEFDQKNINGYLKCSVNHCTYRDFMSEKEYAELVRNKSYEKLLKLDETEEFLIKLLKIAENKNVIDETTKLLLNICIEEKKICRNVYYRAKKAAA